MVSGVSFGVVVVVGRLDGVSLDFEFREEVV